MPILETLLVATAVGCGKFLFRRYASRAAKPLDGTPDSAAAGVLEGLAGAAGEGVASGLGDLVKERLKKADDQRRATREFEELGERVVEGLRKDLQGLHGNVPDDRWERVHEWVNLALAGNLTADFVVRNQVDSVKLFEALRAVPLNIPGPVTDDDRELYHSTLREVARHLAAAASKLPKFDEANARASLDLLASLRTDFDTVLDDVRTIREHVERAQGPGAHDEFETDYRQRVVQRLDFVELFGVALAEELSRTRLTDAYVTLSLTNTRDDDEDDDAEADPGADDPDAGNLATDVALDKLLPETGRLLVRGAAGAGKTTFMKWAAITAARMTPSQRDWRDRRGFEHGPDGIRLRSDDELARGDRNWRPRVPFIVFLRHCPGGKLPTPQEFPKLLSTALGDPPPNWVRNILKAGRGLVLLDGVDEIPHASRAELRRSLADLVQAYPASYFVVTTRPEAVDPAWLDDLGFREAEVVPMSPEDRDGFIRRWYEVVARGRREPAVREKAEQLIADLGTAPWLVRLVTNPMLCAMTCAQYLASRGTLPESLREMCETLCKVLLHQLDLDRKIDLSQFPHPYPVMSYEQKKAVMRQAAYSFVMNGRSALPEPDVVQAVGLALKRIPDRDAAEAEVVFRCMLERSGMIRESTPEDVATDTPATIEFLHNTFKEFLAGEQIADENLHPMLLSKLDDEAWRRVGLFAFAAGTAAFQNALLRGVFNSIPEQMPKASRKRAPAETEKTRARAIFALQCRALATQCDDVVKARLNDVAAQVVPPRTLTDAAWLAAAGNVVVPHLKYQHRVGSVQTACARTLKLIGTPEALREPRAYGSDDRKAVFEELFEVVPCTSTRITSVYFYGRDMSGLANLASLPNLGSVSLEKCRGITDITPFSRLTKLRSLNLRQTDVSNLKPLAGLRELTDLDLSSCNGITDLSPLTNLTTLTTLSLSNTPVADVSPLAGLTALSFLHLSNIQVTDLTSVADLPKLTALFLEGVKADRTCLTRKLNLQIYG